MRKTQTLNATPPKGIYRSIIADYDLTLGLCELIDNAIDIWHKTDKQNVLDINIDIDDEHQRIHIKDNAGGISEDDIVLFVSPGRTSNTGTDESIGIFGVGSKRALVALAQNIVVKSRAGMQRTIQVTIDDSWLEDESWNFDVYTVSDITQNTTIIELFNLRTAIKSEDIDNIRDHIAYTYAFFLQDSKITIKVNDEKIDPIFFDSEWSYPKPYIPKEINLVLPIKGKQIYINILAGLLKEGSSAEGEYGVYFYCNGRLISRANRSYELGYTKGKAGLPNHPSIALARIIVKINGEAQFMPWNSSKSGINYKHIVFEKIRDELINVVTYYVSLSRRFQGEWPTKVFPFSSGEIEKKTLKLLLKLNVFMRYHYLRVKSSPVI